MFWGRLICNFSGIVLKLRDFFFLFFFCLLLVVSFGFSIECHWTSLASKLHWA